MYELIEFNCCLLLSFNESRYLPSVNCDPESWWEKKNLSPSFSLSIWNSEWQCQELKCIETWSVMMHEKVWPRFDPWERFSNRPPTYKSISSTLSYTEDSRSIWSEFIWSERSLKLVAEDKPQRDLISVIYMNKAKCPPPPPFRSFLNTNLQPKHLLANETRSNLGLKARILFWKAR